MAYDEKLADRIRQVFNQRVVLFEEKRRMGGLCFMVHGKMCVGVEKDRLMARIGPDAYDAALRRRGCVPMDFTGRPMRGFVFVNSEGIDTKPELERWLNLALEFNPQAVSSERKKPNSRKAASSPKRAKRRTD